MTRCCIVSDCKVTVDPGKRMCLAHWKALPGNFRSRLSLGRHFKRSRISDEMWDEAQRIAERLA